jgi:hypothetical protein
MRKFALMTAAAAALTLSAGAASAQVWMPMIERHAVLLDRIDAGLATGDITPAEAAGMRADMRALVSLEGRYRWGGLSAREKIDLDRRFAMIDDELRIAMRTGAPERVLALEDRKLEAEERIDAGVNSGQITAAEAAALRDDFSALLATEADYRVDGLSRAERVELDRRFDELSDRIQLARTDADRVYGYNRYR